MCKFYSAIVTREGKLLHNKFLTSHEDLIRLFNCNEGVRNVSNDPNFIRVEFSPENQKYCDINDYKLEVDENSTPIWFDELLRDTITEELTNVVKSMIRLSENISILAGDVVIIGQNTIVDKMVNSHIIYMENSSVNLMWENSSVNLMWGNSSVKEMRGNSSVNLMRENSSVNLMRENSSVKEMWENSSVNLMWGNSSVKEMRENSSVNLMRENSSVNFMWENSSVKEMWENSKKP
jgi:hypothetical protein